MPKPDNGDNDKDQHNETDYESNESEQLQIMSKEEFQKSLDDEAYETQIDKEIAEHPGIVEKIFDSFEKAREDRRAGGGSYNPESGEGAESPKENRKGKETRFADTEIADEEDEAYAATAKRDAEEKGKGKEPAKEEKTGPMRK